MGENGSAAGASLQLNFECADARATLYATDEAALNECLDKPVVCVVGAFDGVHLGHRSLFERGLTETRRRGGSCVVVMFNPDPAKVVSPSSEPSDLLGISARRQIIQATTGASVLVVDFTARLAGLAYDDFVDSVLRKAFDLRCICVGTNFRLGAKGAGNVLALTRLGQDRGFDVAAVDLAVAGGLPVSATRIRGLLCEGKVEAAAELLGRPHTVFGLVVHGRGEGSAFGFPTANIELGAVDCLPAQGVYAALCVPLADGARQAFPAAVNVGAPPTFSAAAAGSAFLEANLLGFSGDLYGSAVACLFMRWLRDSRPFGSLEELRQTVLGNIDWVARTFGDQGISL